MLLLTPVPHATVHLLQHALDTYQSETNKTSAVWAGFTDADLCWRPAERSMTVIEVMKHHFLSERRFFEAFLGSNEPPASEVIPPESTVEAFRRRMVELAAPRLPPSCLAARTLVAGGGTLLRCGARARLDSVASHSSLRPPSDAADGMPPVAWQTSSLGVRPHRRSDLVRGHADGQPHCWQSVVSHLLLVTIPFLCNGNLLVVSFPADQTSAGYNGYRRAENLWPGKTPG